MAYPPQQGPYGGYQQQTGPYGPPPQKNRAPLFATLLFVVALLAGLGITGFVAPGFFLSDDDGKSSGDSADGGGRGGGGAPAPGGDIEDGPADPTIKGGPAPAPDDSGGGDSGGDRPGADGGVTADDGEAMAEEFLTAVNDLDSVEANDMVCPDSPSNSLVDYVIKKDPDLAIDTVEATKYFLDVELKGTLGGKPLNLGKISVKLTGEGAPCVFTFNAG